MAEDWGHLVVYATERGNEAYYWPERCRLALELLTMPFLIAHGMYVTFMLANGRGTYRITEYDRDTQHYHLQRENAEVWMTE